MTGTGGGNVLIVDDEPEIIDLYAAWLENEHDVLEATSGTEALDLVDDDVGVVLLDRKMPDRSGDEVLAAIRERGLDCRVAIVSAIEPSFDVVDMPFDDYLIKPIFFNELTETVEKLFALNRYDEPIQEYFSLVSKVAAVQVSLPTDKLASNEQYADLQARLTASRQTVRDESDEFTDAGGFEETFKRLSRHWDVLSTATASTGAASD